MMTFSACRACGSGCCFLTHPPPTPCSLGVTGGPRLQHFTHSKLHVHVCNFTKPISTHFKNTWTYLDPQYLAFIICFPCFSPEAYPAMERGRLGSGTHHLGAVSSLSQPAPPAFRYISVAINCSRGRTDHFLWWGQMQPTWTMLVLSEPWISIYNFDRISVSILDSQIYLKQQKIWKLCSKGGNYDLNLENTFLNRFTY